MPYNGCKHQKIHLLLISYQVFLATFLKFAEYVDMLIQIIYAKFKNDRTKDNGYTGCKKMEKNFFSKNDFSSLYFIVVLQYSGQVARLHYQGYW